MTPETQMHAVILEALKREIRRGTEEDPGERVIAAIDRTIEWLYQANGVKRESP